MGDHSNPKAGSLVQALPALHEVLRWEALERLGRGAPRWVLREAGRRVLARERAAVLQGLVEAVAPREEIEQRIEREVASILKPSIRKVVNATGVVLHTGLGRAPLAARAIEAVRSVAQGYSNLEVDLETGRRGHRYSHVDALLCELTGAEASLVVNNNAAAVFLVLSACAQGREVIVSRGELVEIGGSFRIPDILRQTGATLVEVGTTNRTYPEDYEKAMTSRTGLLLKVHPSNFRVRGFFAEARLPDLVALAKKYSLPLMYDLGSGCLFDLERRLGLSGEPAVDEVVRAGVDIVSFSGDKLLGGPQAGILLGKKKLIEPLRRHPLHRVVRIDKMTLAALEATLRLYKDEYGFLETVPVLRMLAAPAAALRRRALRLKKHLDAVLPGHYETSVTAVVSRAGGGSLPVEDIPGVAVRLRSRGPAVSAERVLGFLRSFEPPVIARVEDDAVVLDVRTLLPGEERIVCRALEAFARSEGA